MIDWSRTTSDDGRSGASARRVIAADRGDGIGLSLVEAGCELSSMGPSRDLLGSGPQEQSLLRSKSVLLMTQMNAFLILRMGPLHQD